MLRFSGQQRCLLELTSVILTLLLLFSVAYADGIPPEGTACVVSAGNRNAPLAPDGTYTIFGIPGDAGAVRARATCSDGSVGQSGMQFTDPNEEVVLELGPIEFGRLDPVPVAVHLSAPTSRLTTGQSAQMQLLAVGVDGSQWDATPRSAGTTYYLSNRLLASISEDGLVQIHPQFAPGSSARVMVGGTAEGSVSSTFMFSLGPRGRLAGRLLRADGLTPVVGGQVSVLRLQPMEDAGTAVTDAAGEFLLEEVNAGSFLVSAIEPSTGDRALASARIENEGETAQVELRLNGLGTVNVTVVDASDQNVVGAVVTYTALGPYRAVRNLETGAAGVASFVGVPAGDFTVSTRDPVTRLIGAAVDRVEAGGSLDIVLRLQPVGTIQGRVLDVGGAPPVAGVMVRVASRERGVLTQSITGADGAFEFDSLPIADGPFTLDAFVGGRLRARVPGVVLSQPNQTVERDIVFEPVGSVAGRVRNPSGQAQPGAQVSLQTLGGLALRFDAVADAQGRFDFRVIPLGDFELTATTVEGRIGRSAGALSSEGQHVEVDVVVAEDTLVGRVFQRDGVTPVGAGVAVYLAPRSAGLHYSLAGHPAAIVTQTDADGRYGFSVPRADTWVVQAEEGLERGRSSVTVVNLNPSQPLVADLVFLAKGSVTGIVRDSAGVPQVDVPVVVRTQGAFVSERSMRTDGTGRYTMDGVFAGDLTVFASNETTQLSGVATGRLDAEGQTVVLNVTLAATGVVQGQVQLRDGAIVPDPVRIALRRNGVLVQVLELADGSEYRFEAVPIGDIRLEAERLATGDRGIATTRLNAAGEVKTIPVRLVGQAQVRVRLIDQNDQPVAGAHVTLSQQSPFESSQERESDALGEVVFEHAFAGDFSVSASKPAPFGRLSGSASGTLLPGVDQDLLIQMQALPFGRIVGTVFEANGVTPAPGKIVRMLPEPLPNAFVAVTDAEGRYAFDPVDAGTYTVDVMDFFLPGSSACPNRDRIRGRATGVALSGQGEEVVANVQLIGRGSVGGTVVDALGQPAGGIEIRLTNPDPVYGANVTCGGRTTYDTVTDAAGNYLLADVPPGDFTMIAQNANRTRRAEAVGRVRFDGDHVDLDLTLIDSAITMPHTFHDANGFRFDIQGNGSIGAGTNNVFVGDGPDNAAMRLDIIHNGVPVPFLNGDGSIGRLDADGQQLEVDDETPSGLTVSRRILAPRAGYFSRYLETLENPTQAPITVSVRVRSHHRSADSHPRVVDTSDGDQILSVADPTDPDRWAVIDDQLDADPFTGSSIPATGHLFDGADAAVRVSQATYQLVGTTGRLIYQWDDITVPPGGRAILMHFAFHQIDREAAREAATRLALLPPEAIDDLTTDERADVLNFAVPEQSDVVPLPNLDAGVVHGRVLSGDGETPMTGAQVRFKSKHPLFGRQRFVNSTGNGAFQFRSTLSGTASNYVIPVHAFDLSASYPPSGAQSAMAHGDFASGQTQVEQDILFFSTGNVRGVVQRHNAALVADAQVDLCRFASGPCTDQPPNPSNRAYTGADGAYLMLGSPPRDYFLFARKPHPQGPRPILGAAAVPVAVTAGDTVVADVTLEPTGSIAGTVRTPEGTPVVNARVDLWITPGGSADRTTTTDTAGFYRLFDVPVGDHQLRARDTISGAQGTAEATVSVDIESQRDIVLAGFGALHVRVEFARGLAAGNAHVTAAGASGDSGYADSNGEISFQLPQGGYQVRAYHPDNMHSSVSAMVEATIEALGDQVDVLVTLPPAGAVVGTIVRPDSTTLAGGFPYTVRQIRGTGTNLRQGHTDDAGNYRAAGLPVGGYVVTAYDPAQDRFADQEFDIEEDGQEVQVDLVLLENRIALPATLRDANRFAFDVQRSGALAQGDGAFADAGVQLEINGQPFVGDSSARLEADRRQFAIEQPTAIDGLTVTRRVYVPRGAYFARYVETMENPTGGPVSVSVRLTTQFAGGQVQATSSGDTGVDAQDRWVMVDDGVDDDIRLYGNQMPPTVHVFSDDEPGTVAPSTVLLDTETGRPRLRQTWHNLTVPAGGRVDLVHFVIQQVNRAGALAAAERLLDIPPEALGDLPAGTPDSSINFALPEDGQSNVEPLPSLTGRISGVAYEGDARTPVRGARITVQSTHPLFNRVWGKRVDPFIGCGGPGTVVPSLLSLVESPGGVTNPPPEGSYELQGQLTAADSIALPEGVEARVVAQEAASCYGFYAGHPFTRYVSRSELVAATVEHDVIWDSGILTGTIVGPGDFSVTGGRLYRSIDDPDPLYPVYAPIRSDATYVYPGLPPGRYDLLFDTQHPQGSGSNGGLLRGQRTQVDVTLGEITVTDVSMQPTGALQGTLLTATGEPSRDARMILAGVADGQHYDQCATNCAEATLNKHKGKRPVLREVRTDSLGRYSFAAVPVGGYTLTAVDPVSEGRVSVPLNVTDGTVGVQNMILLALGSAELQVRKASGAAVVDALVYLNAQSVGFEKLAGRTNGAGQLTIANIPIGDYTLRIRDPRHPSAAIMDRTTSGSISAGGQVDQHEVILRAAATLQIDVVDGDQGGQPVAGATVWVRDVDGERHFGTTNSQGRVLAVPVLAGSYTVRARAVIGGVTREELVHGNIAAADDEQTRPVLVDLRNAVLPLPQNVYDANRQLYQISVSGGVAQLPQLLINGQAFTGAATAAQQLGRRQYVIEQAEPIAGLHVSRKVFVPRNGYFARYLEVLENRTGGAITVDARVQAQTPSSWTVHATSSGDNQIDGNDRWFTVGTNATGVARAFVASAPEGLLASPALAYVTGGGVRTASATWPGLSIGPGERLVLMHFVVQQLNPAAALASAERLFLLPPEAIEGISAEEALSIGNFGVPEDGLSLVEPLPMLEAAVLGRVLEGDGVTPVPNAQVRLRSLHPLFPREWTPSTIGALWTNSAGQYSIVGVLRDDSASIAIPAGYDVALTVPHPVTGMAWSETASFEPGETVLEHDIVFESGALFGAITGAYQASINNGTVRAFVGSTQVASASINSQGRYSLGGLAGGTYRLTAEAGFNGMGGTQITGEVPEVIVPVGSRIEQDVPLVPNGGLTGRVFSSVGDLRPNQTVRLRRVGTSFSRSLSSNAQGRYTFNAVPAGEYVVSATDSVTGAFVTATVVVQADQSTEQDLTLLGYGQVTATVTYARGEPVAGRSITLRAPSIEGSQSHGPTDAQGRRTMSIAIGPYTLSMQHPVTGQATEVSGEVLSHGHNSTIDLVLKASASLRVRVVDAEQGGDPIPGVRVNYTRTDTGVSQQSGFTDTDGWVQINNLHETSYALIAYAPDGRRGSGSFVVDASVDGQLVETTLSIQPKGETEGSFTFGQARHLYSVYAEAGQTIAVSIRSSTNCDVRVQVYGPTNTLLATGYGRGPSGNFGQVNEFGDLRQIVVTSTGYQTITVSPRLTGCFNTGYFLTATVDGEQGDLLPFQNGGVIHGRVFMPDGETPVAQARVRLRVTNTPQVGLEMLSDETGAFEFAPLPLGSFVLEYVPDSGSQQAVQEYGWLEAGQTIERDLVLPSVTTVEVAVVDAEGLPLGAGVRVAFRPVGSWWTNRYTDAQGRVSYVYVGNSMLGVRAYHPTVSSVFDHVDVAPADGQLIELTLSPQPAQVSGRVLDSDGTFVSDGWVELVMPADGESLRETYTDAQGRFELLNIPADVDLRLRAADPHNGAYSSVDVRVAANQVAERDIQLAGRGVVHGRVATLDGDPLGNVYVRASYFVDDEGTYLSQRSDYTDEDGRFRIEHLPVGRELELRASVYVFGHSYEAFETVQLAQHDEELEQDLTITLPTGSLLVRVLGSDGEPADGWCSAYLNTGGGSDWLVAKGGGWNWVEGPCEDGLRFIGLPPGSVTVYGWTDYLNLEERSAIIQEGEITEVVYAFSVVRGVVHYADAEPVTDASMRLEQAEGEMAYGHTREDGSYRVLGGTVGEFVIEAQDHRSGLSAFADGELVDESVPVTVDLVLPPTGLVEGEVRDHDGEPVADAVVYARSAGLDFDLETYTDELGRFAFDRVGLGAVHLSAVHPWSGNVAVGETSLASQGQIVEVLLQFPQPASLSGLVSRPDGSPAAGLCASMRSTEEGAGYEQFYRSQQLDANGAFSFSVVPPGHYELWSTTCWGQDLAAVHNGQLAPGETAQVNLQLGSGVQSGYISLADSVSGYTSTLFSYMNAWRAMPSDGTWHPAYHYAYQLSVDGAVYPDREVGALRQEGREVAFGSQGMSGVRVERRFYVPEAGGYARLFDRFTNPGDAPVQITVRYENNLNHWNDVWPFTFAATAGRYVIHSPANPAMNQASGHAAHVLAGSDAPVPDAFQALPDSSWFTWTWTLQLAPGETRGLLHYSVPRLPSVFGGIQTQAEALSAQTVPGMFDGLSEAERASLHNFAVPTP